MEEERNNWDRANPQGKNIDIHSEEESEQYLRDDVREEEETNPNKDADGYGSESARSDHSHYKSGFGSRTGNNDDNPSFYGTRNRENFGSGSQGSSGRSS